MKKDREFYAKVTITPENPPESPEGTYFRLEDLEQALVDCGLAKTATYPYFETIKPHLPRHPRPSGDYFTVEELEIAMTETEPRSYHAIMEDRLSRWSRQARKNRIYDAFGK